MASPDAIAKYAQRHRKALVGAAADTLASEIAAYGAFPREVLEGDIAETIRNNVEMFVDSLRTGASPPPATLAKIRSSAAKRAEERVPLDMMVSAYPLAARLIVDRVVTGVAAEDGVDETVPITFVADLLDFLRVVIGDAVAGYLEEYQLIQAVSETSERRLLYSLVTGQQIDLTDDIELADSYLVVALELGPHPDELVDGVNAGIAARRKLRRVRTALADLTGDRQLTSLTPEGGLVLLPVPMAPDWLDRVARAAAAPATAGFAVAPRAGVAAAVQIAREVIEVVQLLGLPPAAYGIDDVPFEYQATRPGPARDALALRLQPIAGDPDLLLTLRCYLAAGGNRRKAARAIGAHPNTIDNRLRRIGTLTGFMLPDPSVESNARMALLAHDAALRGIGRTTLNR